MEQFLDIEGASGAVYRFRPVAPPTQLPATAGNFVLVSADGDEFICCGTALSLLQAAVSWRTVAREHPRCRLYVRLNVFRSARVSEHDDIVARHSPDRVLTELDMAPPPPEPTISTIRAVAAR